MSFKPLFILVPVLSFAVLTGCKTSCTGLCDDGKDGDCATTSTQTIDGVEVPKSTFDHDQCYAMCERQKDMEDDDVEDCKDEWDALLSCADAQDDICNVWQVDDIDTDTGEIKLKKCNSEWNDYDSCVSDFCADHTKRDYCN